MHSIKAQCVVLSLCFVCVYLEIRALVVCVELLIQQRDNFLEPVIEALRHLVDLGVQLLLELVDTRRRVFVAFAVVINEIPVIRESILMG